MVRAEFNDKMDDLEMEIHGDVLAVSAEVMSLVREVGKQLEELTGISSRTHIVNMCKMVIDDHMTMSQTIDLAEKTMNGEEVSLDE